MGQHDFKRGHVELQGFDELEKLLGGLATEAVNKKVVRSALRKAARPVIMAARRKVMNYSKTVGKSITINYQSRTGDTIGVGPKKSGKAVDLGGGEYDISGIKDPWFAHFIEFGTSGIGRFKTLDPKRKKRSRFAQTIRRYRADQPERPFLRPAFEETKQQVTNEFGQNVSKAIDDYIKRVSKYVA